MEQTYSTDVDLPPDVLFAAITDLDRLAEWNRVITRVIERPDWLVPGAQWVVELASTGRRWRSRSTLIDHDRKDYRFVYRSRSDDGNPSWVDWSWALRSTHSGTSAITVTWDVVSRTPWRRHVTNRLRSLELRREVPASVQALVGMLSGFPHFDDDAPAGDRQHR